MTSSLVPAAPRTFAFWLLLAGTAVHAAAILQAQPLQSANDRSRWATVRALLEQGTYRLDDVRRDKGWDTIDLIKDGDHYYSTKPPILATWMAGVVWCLCRVTGWSLAVNTQPVTSVALLLANGLPMFASWFVFWRLLQQTMQNSWGQAFLLCAAVFATLLTPFSVVLNNHTVAATGAMFTIYALWKTLGPLPSKDRKAPESASRPPVTSAQGTEDARSERMAPAHPHPCWFALCGFFAGWTCAHELPAALLGVATFLLACRRSVAKTLLAYVPAALIPIGFFFLTNWIATGSLKPAYADYGSEKYRFVVDGVPSYWMEPKGLDQNLDSTPVYLFHCLIGHHGLFSLTPVWLLLIPAWFASIAGLWRRSPSASIAAVPMSLGAPLPDRPDHGGSLRTLSLLSLLLSVVVLAFYLTRTENYNYGGNTSGLRWALWLVPFWLVTLIPLVDRLGDRPILRIAAVPLFLFSAYAAWSRVDNPWRHPWIFEWMEARGKALAGTPPTSRIQTLWRKLSTVPDLSEPRPPLPHSLWTWFAAIPDVSDGHLRWMEFVNLSVTHGTCRLRLEAGPSQLGPHHVALTVTRRCNDKAPETICQVDVDREAFRLGAEPTKVINWSDPNASADQIQAELSFLRGLPVTQPYRAGVVRYRKTPLRRDAFRCQHALAQVKLDQPPRQYRCDIWLCEELPFGIAEVEFQTLDAVTGLTLHQERWQAAACEPPPPPHAQWSPAP